jgi:diacylglycerol O-acyltransferase / wax synthase
MPQKRENDRLSGGDALFLHLEREGMPLNVASVNIFEGVISLEACTRFIESKLPLIPRYLQRVVIPPFNIGLPTWEFDPDFDLRKHVHQVTLKRGTDAELKAVAGKILSEVFDRQRPLWDFTLIHGLKGNRTGVVTRMHHCLADGLAGVALLNVLMDPSPEVRPLPKKKLRLPKPTRKDAPTSLLDELITSPFSVAQRVLAAQRELLNLFQQVVVTDHHSEENTSHPQPGSNSPGGNSNVHMPSVDEFARYMPEVTASTQPLPFNIICRGPQKFSWAEIPLADIKAVKNACGATVNDVVLTVMTSTIRRYAEMRGVRVRGRLLRIGVPVNVRSKGTAGDLGNRITFVPVTLPLDIRSPRKLLTAIRERVAFLRGAHVAELVGLAGSVLGTIPTAAQVLVGSIVNQLPLGLCNIVCTNVPGPEAPLYLLGHKMLRCYPYVPIGGDLGLNCAVLTYNGTACFGFSGNAQAAPGLDRLEAFLAASFAELWKASRIDTPRRKKTPAKAKAAATQATSAPVPEQPVVAAIRVPAESVRATHRENDLLTRVAV